MNPLVVLFAILCAGSLVSDLAAQVVHVVVPVEIVDNLVYTTGAIDGLRDLSVILDTGSSASIVDPRVAQRLGLTPAGSVHAAGLGHGTSETIHFLSGATLSVGNSDILLRNQQIGTLAISYIASEVGRPTDALFGSKFFESYCVTVDYEKQQIVFSQPGACKHMAGAVVPIRVVGGIPFVTAALIGSDGTRVNARFLLDSGTTGALILSQSFLAIHPSLVASGRIVRMPPVEAIGGTINTSLIRVPGLRLGSFSLSGVVARVPQTTAGVFADSSIAGFIGAGILDRFTVTWDYQQSLMVLRPNAYFSGPFEADSSGLRLAVVPPDYTTILVASVLPGSPADIAGIRKGDTIVSVNGEEKRLWQITEALEHPGSQVILEIRRGKMLWRSILRLQRLV